MNQTVFNSRDLKIQFSKSMAEMRGAFPSFKQPEEEWKVTQRAYWKELHTYDISVIKKAMLAASRGSKFFPSLSDLVSICNDRQKAFVAVQKANKYPQLESGTVDFDPNDGPKTTKGKTVEALINALGKPQGPEEVKKYIKGVNEILASI